MEIKNIHSVDEVMDTFIQGAGKISSALLGMVNKVGGQIYALLFLSEKPLSLDEIAEKLHISKSNISVNIRMLEEFRLVKKVWVKGSRKDYYEAALVYPKKVIGGFLEKILLNIKDANSIIQETQDKISLEKKNYSSTDLSKAEFMMQRLNLLGLFYNAALNFFNDFFENKPVDVDLLRKVIANPEELQNPMEK